MKSGGAQWRARESGEWRVMSGEANKTRKPFGFLDNAHGQRPRSFVKAAGFPRFNSPLPTPHSKRELRSRVESSPRESIVVLKGPTGRNVTAQGNALGPRVDQMEKPQRGATIGRGSRNRHRVAPLFRPFRALNLVADRNPRAMPWATMCGPFRAQTDIPDPWRSGTPFRP
jgi:hypothetical protein